MTTTTTARLTDVVRENVAALQLVREQAARRRTHGERLADAVARFAGSTRSIVVHAALVAAWLVVNAGVVPGIRPFDPYPFVMLAMIASVEAIFLTSFVLMSQARLARVADQRADLDLHVDLLSELEITRLVATVDRIAERVGAK